MSLALHSLSPVPTSDAGPAPPIHLAPAPPPALVPSLDQGLHNHFPVTVPGRQGPTLFLLFGGHGWEARASEMMVFDDQGKTVEGDSKVELSAYCIHAPIHRLTGARVVMHTHQPYTLTLNMLKDNRVLPATQTAAFYHGRIAYDDHYAGTADYPAEGERLAKLMGDKPIAVLKNHGGPVTGGKDAPAYRRPYSVGGVRR